MFCSVTETATNGSLCALRRAELHRRGAVHHHTPSALQLASRSHLLLQAGDSSSDAAGDELDVTTPTGAGATSTATTAARPGSAASKLQARSEMEWSRLAQLHSPFGDSGAHDGRSKLPSASQVLKAQADDEDAAFSESRTASTATSSSESERDCEDCAQCRHEGEGGLNTVAEIWSQSQYESAPSHSSTSFLGGQRDGQRFVADPH